MEPIAIGGSGEPLEVIPDLVPSGPNYEDTRLFLTLDATQEELRILNHIIVVRLKELNRQLARSFQVDDEVEFTTQSHSKKKHLNGTWRGKITKIRGQALGVRAQKVGAKNKKELGFFNWKVSVSLVKKV